MLDDEVAIIYLLSHPIDQCPACISFPYVADDETRIFFWPCFAHKKELES